MKALWWLIRSKIRQYFRPTPEEMLERLYEEQAEAQLVLDYIHACQDHIRTIIEQEKYREAI